MEQVEPAGEIAPPTPADPDAMPRETLVQLWLARRARRLAGLAPEPDALPQLNEQDLFYRVRSRIGGKEMNRILEAATPLPAPRRSRLADLKHLPYPPWRF